MRWFAVCALALTLAPSALGSNVATPKMNAVASWAAGKPVTVWCENDSQAWSRRLADVGARDSAQGYAWAGGNEVFIGPVGCDPLVRQGDSLGVGLNLLLHEATHARGWVDEALTECAARVLIYSALHDFYGVPWFSMRMRDTVDRALGYSFGLPAIYQGGCDRL